MLFTAVEFVCVEKLMTAQIENLLTADLALYRGLLQRIIRATTGYADNKSATKKLSTAVFNIGLVAPKVVADALDAHFEIAAKALEDGNNSVDPALLHKGMENCRRYRASAEQVLALFAVEVEYPGLYPRFKVDGYDYFGTFAALKGAIKETV